MEDAPHTFDHLLLDLRQTSMHTPSHTLLLRKRLTFNSQLDGTPVPRLSQLINVRETTFRKGIFVSRHIDHQRDWHMVH
jgi:hypothetical protein